MPIVWPVKSLTPILGILALTALAGGCASSGATPRPFPVPGGRPSESSADRPPGGAVTGSIAGIALALRGTPYRNGGSDPDGFDCSGFTQYVFNEHGVALPREVRDQFKVGRSVKPNEVEPGDLLFFSTVAPGVSHVAIALGGGEFIHAPSSTGVVRVEHLASSYWSRRFVGARRIA